MPELHKSVASPREHSYTGPGMYPPVMTKNPEAVEAVAQATFLAMFPHSDRQFVPRVFGWAKACFTGQYGDYQAVDAHYHDFEHTLQGTLCMMRLLEARHRAGAQPQFTEQYFQLGLIAILFHDTGYLKTRDDTEGTGAKYTITHVDRSADFAGRVLQEKGFSSEDINAVQNMIGCTGVDAKLDLIPFQNDLERITGFALASGDLLGQMAAPDYVEKLPVLYLEFAEAAHYVGNKNHFIGSFSDASDLMRRTPVFWENFVLPKLHQELGQLYRFLNDPYPDGTNEYLQRIEANMQRLRQETSSLGTKTGFAKRLQVEG